jgi:hypothetical protein
VEQVTQGAQRIETISFQEGFPTKEFGILPLFQTSDLSLCFLFFVYGGKEVVAHSSRVEQTKTQPR